MTTRRLLRIIRRRALAALALLLAAGAVVAIVLATGSRSPAQPAAGSRAAGAATVQRRNLVQTDTEAGTLSYANPQTVYDRLSGTITWLPSVGQLVRPGGTLFRVNGRPVILMNGRTPAYRTLSAADSSGSDVLELNRNLVALGFNASGITVDDVWQPGTTVGVELLQQSLGETATGSLSLGQVVFLPGAQLISTVQGTLGDTANGGGTQAASATVAPPGPQFVSLRTPAGSSSTTTATTTTTTTTPTAPAPTTPAMTPTTPTAPGHHRRPKHGAAQTPTLAALLALLRAQSAQLRAEAAQLAAAERQNAHGNSPSSGSPGGGHGTGGSGSSGTAVLQTTSIHLVVTVDLDASLQSEAKVGERVTVQLPAGNAVTGRVSAVSSVAQSSSGSGANGNGGGNGGGGNGGGGGGGGNGSGSSSTIPVTVTLPRHHLGAGLDEAAVSVSFAQARANHVLSVPVTALLAVGGGNYAVQTAGAPHTLIPVTVGLFAAGYVQISGPGVHPGLQVTDSQG